MLLSKIGPTLTPSIHDMTKSDLYCEIQGVSIDKSTGWMAIDFDYRGGTRVNLSPVAEDSLAMRGSYKINLPILGDSDVQVTLMFSADGSAREEWRNMGFGGAFDISRR